MDYPCGPNVITGGEKRERSREERARGERERGGFEDTASFETGERATSQGMHMTDR